MSANLGQWGKLSSPLGWTDRWTHPFFMRCKIFPRKVVEMFVGSKSDYSNEVRLATENCDFWFQKRRRSRKSYWLKVFANRNVFHRKIIIFQHFLFVIFGLRWFHCCTLFLIALAQILTEQIWHDGKIGGWKAGRVDCRRRDEAKRKHDWIPFSHCCLGYDRQKYDDTGESFFPRLIIFPINSTDGGGQGWTKCLFKCLAKTESFSKSFFAWWIYGFWVDFMKRKSQITNWLNFFSVRAY